MADEWARFELARAIHSKMQETGGGPEYRRWARAYSREHPEYSDDDWYKAETAVAEVPADDARPGGDPT